MKLAHSFKYAFAGLKAGLSETNMQIHWAVALVVLAAGVFLGLSMIEWAVVCVCIGVVIMAELFNTALEEMIDALTAHSPKLYDTMGKPKDIAAAAVLTAAATAAITGLIIFVPRIIFVLTVPHA